MSIELGQIIDEKYRIVRLLGEGGMGSVYEGENTRIRRRVAIKVLNSALASNGELVARFEREAQAAGQIGNDHILEVLDLGSLPDGNRYMVMEYLDGETLLDRIRRHVRLDPEHVIPIARQFLSALDAAHAAGIIHRDLKPENIFILREKAGRPDFVKLIDFGISKFANLGPDAFRVTRAGALIGTPSYMAPEQARGVGDADVRSDIYAVGVILYESVTGRLPFDEVASFNDLMFKIALSDPPPPSTHVPGFDREFERIIQRAMARDPAQRFQTVQELLDALEEWATSRSVPLSIAPPRRSRLSVPDDFPRLPPAETQMETVTALPLVSRKDAEIGATIPNETPPAVESTPSFTPAFGRKNKVIAGVASASALVVVGVIAAVTVASSGSRAQAVGITPVAASETPSATTTAEPLATPNENAAAVPPLDSAAVPDEPPASPSASSATSTPTKRANTPAGHGGPATSAWLRTTTPATKSSGKPSGKPPAKTPGGGHDFGY